MPIERRPRRVIQIVLLILLACIADAGAAYSPRVPSQWLLNVRETGGVARTGEVLRSGVPVPRSLNLRSTVSLAVVDTAGTPVPAEFKVTARWNANRNDTSAPIQWLLVSFPATVGANATATYRVITDGSVANPAPARRLTLTQSGNAVTVDTGAAVFRLGSSAGSLFDEVVLDNGTRLVGGGALRTTVNGTAAGHSTIRKVWVEHSGPLSAVVVVEGAYDVAPIGNGQISTLRRYVFTAGSPTAVVRHVVNWEGNLACNGCTTTTAGTPNGVLLGQTRDTLNVELGGTPTVTAVGAFASSAIARSVAAGDTAAVRQLLRAGRTSPLQFTVDVGGATAAGTKADGGVLAASGPRGAVAIGLSQMHRYEPQALRLLADGNLAVDIVDDKAWVAHHQGLFATLAVSALPAAPSRSTLDRLVWAPLNRPLHAWPEAQWFVASDAVEEFPVGQLPAEYAAYDTLMTSVLSRTMQQMDALGTTGIMTFGVYPRYWGKTGAPGELDCGAGDPTPGDTWDNTFWCGTWTDYHNTVSMVPYWAMRTGDVEWLDELAFPGALRTLHTQIMQCSSTERWFYCGQAPTGYKAYRSDFNSSHAYFENLYLYYWLTGDFTVVKTLQRGGDSMRRFMCSLRGPTPVTEPDGPDGPACPADHPVNPKASMTGRVGSQWNAAFRFLGHASDDSSFLEDFRNNLARAYTQQYAELYHNGVRVGLLGDLLTEPGPWGAEPILQENLYDTTNLFRLMRDTGDAPIGIPALAPSHLIHSLARGITDVEMKVVGDGTPAGRWPHGVFYTFSGSRIGGTLTSMVPEDRDLFTPEKTTAVALLVRGAEMGNDSFLAGKGHELVLYTLTAAMNEAAPLGKLHGQYLQRLPSAVARLMADGTTTTPPAPTTPAAPGNLQAAVLSATEVQLSWTDNSSNEEGFRVERSIAGGAFQEIQTVAANATGFRAAGLAAATAYTFRVRAANAAGYSAYSNSASATTLAAPVTPTAPAAPTALQAQVLSGTEVQLTWTDNSGNEDSFRVERSTAGGAFQEIQTVAANATGSRVSGLTAGTAYTFRVRAANAAGFSVYSNSASATTTAPPVATTVPAAPSTLSAKAVSASEIQLTWKDNSTNEATFRVERIINGLWTEIASIPANSTSARVSGLIASTSYSFRLRAANSAGYSAYSNIAKTSTLRSSVTPPAAPSNFSVTYAGSGTVRFTWTDNSANEANFRIERMINGVYKEVLVTGANVTTVNLSGLTDGASYNFRMRASNAAGYSAYSNGDNVNMF